ncbi:MAG: hypothetical protein M3O71_29720 [Bacteroidota bacterium]|nr:hypothetical protein [Bacteroidota bacterium]
MEYRSFAEDISRMSPAHEAMREACLEAIEKSGHTYLRIYKIKISKDPY